MMRARDQQRRKDTSVGVLKTSDYQALTAVRDGQHQHEHGWASADGRITLTAVERLRTMGLCEMAGFDTLDALRPGPPQWAARLTPEGHDTLLYLPVRRTTARPSPPRTGHPGEACEIGLRPQAMDAVLLYLSLGDRLRRPPAPGLEAAVRTAQRAEKGSTWCLRVTRAQADSIAYALWLEARAHSVGPANRLAREHDVQYEPSAP
ncbi:DUF6417 family protein [Streptomyces luteireticuli]|uniref:DUF6417 family protein n=1 Tax=Streptomyces luteireticuli TaxID=173858 RepID=UPI003556D015